MTTRPNKKMVNLWVSVAVISVGVFGVLSAGCATYNRSHEDVDRAIHDWHRRRVTLTTHAPGEPLPQRSENGIPSTDVPNRLIDGYVREALERNPGIQAAMADARAKLERIPQVTSLRDPILKTVIRPEPIQTAAGDTYFTLGLAQKIPLLAKLERAGNIAAAETRMAIERLNGKRVQVIADVERAYWQIYRLDRFVELTRENRRLLEDLENVVDTQYQVGKVQQQDLLRVQIELAKLRDDEHRYGIRRLAVVASLNQLTSHPPLREIPTTTLVDVPTVRADIDTLVTLAADHNPELAVLREQVHRDREQIELAKLGYWPDVTVGFEWNHLDPRKPFSPPLNQATGTQPPVNRMSESATDNWAITLQMNLPIWSHRIEAAKREARQRFLATQNELRSAENLIAFRIFDTWSRVEAQEHTLRVLETELIPQARQTYEVTLTAYQAGQTDFLSLIDNWRRWLHFELMRHRETVDLETAFADLQREVGMQLLRHDTATAEQTGDITNE